MPSKIPSHRPTSPIPTYRPPEPPSEQERRAFYWSTPWRRLRAAQLERHPLCHDCEGQGRTTPANEVHHVTKRRVDPSAELDWSNMMSLCRPCHQVRTSRGE
jgi:5-methylcytosine-specific restriction enzyme A